MRGSKSAEVVKKNGEGGQIAIPNYCYCYCTVVAVSEVRCPTLLWSELSFHPFFTILIVNIHSTANLLLLAAGFGTPRPPEPATKFSFPKGQPFLYLLSESTPLAPLVDFLPLGWYSLSLNLVHKSLQLMVNKYRPPHIGFQTLALQPTFFGLLCPNLENWTRWHNDIDIVCLPMNWFYFRALIRWL
jgi:hypothetical protein